MTVARTIPVTYAVSGLAIDKSDTLFVADSTRGFIYRISSVGETSPWAGPFSGLNTGGNCLAKDSAGNCLVLDCYSDYETQGEQSLPVYTNRIHWINPQGAVETFYSTTTAPCATGMAQPTYRPVCRMSWPWRRG